MVISLRMYSFAQNDAYNVIIHIYGCFTMIAGRSDTAKLLFETDH